jgi:hypothetical protein
MAWGCLDQWRKTNYSGWLRSQRPRLGKGTVAPCKEMQVIPVNKAVDKERITGKNGAGGELGATDPPKNLGAGEEDIRALCICPIWSPCTKGPKWLEILIFVMSPKLGRKRQKNHFSCKQRAILNFTSGPKGWTWNLSPRGNVHPFIHPQGWTLYCLEEWRGEQRSSPPGDNFTPIRGQNSLLGDNFAHGSKLAPRCKVKHGPLAFNEKSYWAVGIFSSVFM